MVITTSRQIYNDGPWSRIAQHGDAAEHAAYLRGLFPVETLRTYEKSTLRLGVTVHSGEYDNGSRFRFKVIVEG